MRGVRVRVVPAAHLRVWDASGEDVRELRCRRSPHARSMPAQHCPQSMQHGARLDEGPRSRRWIDELAARPRLLGPRRGAS